MRVLILLSFLLSSPVYADCLLKIEEDGWMATGQPGIVELNFNADNSVTHRFSGGDENLSYYIYEHGSWKCFDSEITVKLNGTLIIGTIERKNLRGIWSIRFRKNSIISLSGRTLTLFSY